MLRILRAFAWMRWRMLINAFEKTGSRDVLERFSIAVEKLGPILAAVLIVPSALMLFAGSTAAGYALAAGDQASVILVALRYILFFVPLAAIVGPLFLPSGDRTNPVRFLLLPIPRSTIYVAQAASSLGEPWIVLMLPIAAGLPVGLLAGGAFLAAATAIVSGLLLVALTTGIAALATTLLHLIVRDRRRAELLGVIFILVISLTGLIPGMLQGDRRRGPDGVRRGREAELPAWVQSASRQVMRVYPTELHLHAIRSTTAGSLASASASIAALAALAFVVHGVGFLAFGRVLDGSGSSSSRRGGTGGSPAGLRLPGVSTGASAVALAHLRLITRTTRGRTSLMSPVLMLVVFSVLQFQHRGAMDFGSFELQGGLPLAVFTSFIALVSTLPIFMNQFAVDGPGLTMVLLSPLPEAQYLRGKAIGTALIALPLAWLCTLVVYVVFPGGPAAYWVALPLGLAGAYLIAAPAAAVFSAMLPKLADLGSIGRMGNAHGLAGLLGLASMAAGAAPAFGIVAVAGWLGRPWLAPALLLVWCAVAWGIASILFVLAQRIFVSRRENLATLVSRMAQPS